MGLSHDALLSDRPMVPPFLYGLPGVWGWCPGMCVECLKAPPQVRGFLGVCRIRSRPLFLMFLRHRLFNLPRSPLGPIFATFSPPRCPKRPKSDPKGYPLEPIFGHCGSTGGNVKTTFSCRRNLRFHGLRGSRGPLVQHVLAIETAIVAQIAYPTPKNEENVGPMAPKVAQGSPKGVPRGDRRRPFVVVFSTRLPLGAKMVPKPPPRASGTPPGVDLEQFLCNCGCSFSIVFVVLWACFLICHMVCHMGNFSRCLVFGRRHPFGLGIL